MENFNLDDYLQYVMDISCDYSTDEHEKIIKILLDCRKSGKTIFVMGCGGSASTATHFAADLSKTVGGFKAISLVDNIPLVSAYTNDLGWESVFEGQLKTWLKKDDVVIAFSVHGGNSKWSGNITKAIKLAKSKSAKIIGFSGFDGGELKKKADVCIVVPVEEKQYGTPLAESLHSVFAHAIIFDLKGRVK